MAFRKCRSNRPANIPCRTGYDGELVFPVVHHLYNSLKLSDPPQGPQAKPPVFFSPSVTEQLLVVRVTMLHQLLLDVTQRHHRSLPLLIGSERRKNIDGGQIGVT